jgi:hypothetical protein
LQAQEPLQILIAADVSGRRARGVCEPLAGRRVRALSVDNLESVYAAWGAQIVVELDGVKVSLNPRTLDDLHADQLLRSVPPLSELLELRTRLDDPRAAQRLSALLGSAAAGAPVASAAEAQAVGGAPPNATAAGEEQGALLSRLLGGSGGSSGAAAGSSSPAGATRTARSGVDRLIRSIVGEAAAGSSAASGTALALGAAADQEIGRRLRALLRSPPLRALEATWHGIDGLCRSCADDELVRYEVLDASLAELLADLPGLKALLEARHPSLLLVDDYVGASVPELEALQRLLSISAAHGAILITGASPQLAGYAGFAQADAAASELALPAAARAAWEQLAQARAGGAQLALVLPRYLLRQPYGKSGEPLERFDFEELEGDDHEAFVWGNGAYLAARALVMRHGGAGTRLDASVELRELPVVRLRDEQGFRLQPSAEAWLSEGAVERLRGAGFAILQGIRDTDRLRVHV